MGVYAQSNYPFSGLDMNMGNLSRLSNAKTRSISPENFTGEKGKGGMADPVRDKDQYNVAKDLKVTIQNFGLCHDGCYNNQKSDISSTTFF